MATTPFTITNLTCDACVKLSTAALRALPGVTNVVIDLASGHGELTAERDIPKQEIIMALKSVNKEVL
ncbi:MAG TPA: heavy metal transporter [Candidatus Magasanikbacteria bacterium]|nr:MAG: hypothetical protein A3I74_03490 [Candidatus Magasanikbacteria bacterium RIFCSPLOWO2_02_FULL_47_16]OGH80263.1 MAG: hypothetical protein A3C10_03770 [Candidatus Magasanikbacteria bacterium RIFCSPHIGHO2_02_FULL_48_18]OGH81988.1 MAG: hypothetical protein A3G08_00600 [Candidatus Magasanikbacteria bacterium RIFCSPLOWO2_12_FULL_47_9b]HAZ29096.1 heavy metal transporter [Candidatus Magasanikbacteria bacterium]